MTCASRHGRVWCGPRCCRVHTPGFAGTPSRAGAPSQRRAWACRQHSGDSAVEDAAAGCQLRSLSGCTCGSRLPHLQLACRWSGCYSLR
eukprot:2488-Chlamydomonas_euryale.AAC.1